MKRIVILAYMVTVLLSCAKNSNEIIVDFPNKDYSVEEKTELISSYAQMLAASLGNSDLRKEIKKEACYMLDGDYDILAQRIHNVKLTKENRTVRDLMVNSCVITRSQMSGFEGNLDELISEIQRTFPNLQVSVPVHCEAWDAEKFVPLVAFKPYDFDSKTHTTIEAFDVEGNVHVLSAIEEPEFPVIVVSRSERILPNGTSKFDEDAFIETLNGSPLTKATLATPTGLHIKHDAANSLGLYWDAINGEGYYVIQRRAYNESDFRNIAACDASKSFYLNSGLAAGKQYSYQIRHINGSDKSAYTPIITSTVSEREPKEPLKLVWYQLDESTLKIVEPWVDGRPEFRLIVCYRGVTGSNSISVYSKLLNPTRNHIKEGCNPDVTIFPNWDPDIEGSVLTVLWLEEDGLDKEGPEELTINLMSEQQMGGGSVSAEVSAKYEVANEYYKLGEGNVYWWHSRSEVFDHGLKYQLGK